MADVFKITLRGKPSRCWYGKVRDPRTGRWDRWNTKCTSKEVARKLLRQRQETVEKIAAGLLPEEDSRGIAEHLADFVEHLSQKGRSEYYRFQTEVEVVKVALHCAGKKTPKVVSKVSLPEHRKALAGVPLDRITADRLDSFLSSLPAKTSAGTKNKYRQSAVAFFNYLLGKRRVPSNPLMSSTRYAGKKKKVRRALTAAELQRLLDAARKAPGGDVRAAMYATAFYTGLRQNELLSLRVHHVNLGESPALHLPGEFTKNGADARLPFPAHLAKQLSVLVAGLSPADAVFPSTCAKTVFRHYKRDLAAAGIPYADEKGRHADFHALRKSLGTALRIAGVDPGVSRLLMRHSDIRLTMETYNDDSLLDLAGAVAKLPIVG